MIVNIIIWFIIPWISILLYKDKSILLTIMPFQSVIAYTINAFGFYFKLWDVYPFQHKVIVAIPFDIGIYPILSAWMIYFIKQKKINPYAIIFIFTILTTIIEGIGVMLGKIIYGKWWNIGWTFISYLIPYLLNYKYYLSLKKSGIL